MHWISCPYSSRAFQLLLNVVNLRGGKTNFSDFIIIQALSRRTGILYRTFTPSSLMFWHMKWSCQLYLWSKKSTRIKKTQNLTLSISSRENSFVHFPNLPPLPLIQVAPLKSLTRCCCELSPPFSTSISLPCSQHSHTKGQVYAALQSYHIRVLRMFHYSGLRDCEHARICICTWSIESQRWACAPQYTIWGLSSKFFIVLSYQIIQKLLLNHIK